MHSIGPCLTWIIGSRRALRAPGIRAIVPPPACAAALLAVLVYLNALHNPFVYDDYYLIVDNPSLLRLDSLESVLVRHMTRPVVGLSYAIDTWIWGPIPLGYHVTNVLLHALNVVLVFWMVVLTSRDRTQAIARDAGAPASPTVIGFVAAAVFAVHPMMTQAVGYISARSEVAYSALFVLAFLSGRRWMVGGGRRWWAACIGLWAAALLTKETAAMLPLVLLAYDRLVLQADPSERRRRFLRLQLPLLAAALLAGGVRIGVLALVEFRDLRGPDWRFALVALESFWRYLGLFFVPRGQAIFHAVPLIDTMLSMRAIGGLLALTGFIAVAWMLRRRHSVATFGLVWFALLLVPSSALLTLGRGEAMAEHRAYLSAAGLFLTWGYVGGGIWARAGRERRRLAIAAAAVFLASLASLTVVRNIIWQDPVVLAREAATSAPQWWAPRVLLGDTLRKSGRCAEAVPEYLAAIELRPEDELPYYALVDCLVLERRVDEAEETLRVLRVVKPTSHRAVTELGVIALVKGRDDESRALLREALTHAPDNTRAKAMLAFLDGALPAQESRRVCEHLHLLTGRAPALRPCRTSALQHDGNPVVPSSP